MPGESGARTPAGFVHQQGVMIEAQSQTEGEVFHPDGVLRIKGLLAIRRMSVELVAHRQIGIEDLNIARVQTVGDDVVAKLFPNRSKPDLHSGLPFVGAVMAGKAAPHISLAISAIL